MSNNPKDVVRRNTKEVQGRGDFKVFEELFADDFFDHTPQPNSGADKPAFTNLTNTFERHSLISTLKSIGRPATGELVPTYKTYHETHRGPFLTFNGRRPHELRIRAREDEIDEFERTLDARRRR